MASGFSPPSTAVWVVIYPAYFDKKATVSGGRRVNKSLAVDNPRVEDIRAVCEKLKVPYVVEAVRTFIIRLEMMLQDKTYPRDCLNPGRIRVYFLHPSAESKATTKCAFLYEIAPLIAQLKSRQQAAASSTSSSSKSGKKKKR
ncbi:signal recognition particle [Babesia caballi]|uniref:Signal recognition particle n=1 Tax=Babesia caballi TaxID=5871 RepID=A0AAV4M091_BABCB|nr:signal recognition particle [Babesia caballi]